MTGGAFSLTLTVPADAFAVTQGEPVIGGLHGPVAHHYHCDHCKSWVFTRAEGVDWFVNVRTTMLDTPETARPFLETWTAEKLPWMAGFTRNPWPKRIVWLQDDVTHDRFYWLHIPDAAAAKAGDTITASVEGQTITLTGTVPAGTTLRLSDQLLNLDKPVKVIVNGRTTYSGKVARTGLAIEQSLQERADLPSAATAVLKLG